MEVTAGEAPGLGCPLAWSNRCGLILVMQRVHKEQMRITKKIYMPHLLSICVPNEKGLRWRVTVDLQ